ncbi:MAG: TatD family hydrolase [Lachnospiraceae bacterium]|nr:TatD family hydrolase [Lachnospiraceae bacterium]
MRDIFDTHVHYDDDAFDEDRDELIRSLPSQGVALAVDVGASMDSCKKALKLAHGYDHIYCALGVHPEEVYGLDEEGRQWLKDNLDDEKCVALGEIGLDYHWKDVTPEDQKEAFIWQLKLAVEKDKPVIIHSREAARDTADILKEYHNGCGIIHCFSYSKEMALEFLDMGYYIGIGGVLTYKNAKKLVEAAEAVPMERIVLETDGPYLSPDPLRGKRNVSQNISYVITRLAQIKGISEEEVREYAWVNAHKVYRLTGV